MLCTFWNNIKQILLADFAKNKNIENFQISDEIHGLTF